MNRSDFDIVFDSVPDQKHFAQNREEVWGITQDLSAIEVNNVLEVGIQWGQSMMMWDFAAGTDARLLGVDSGRHAVRAYEKDFVNDFTLITGDSTSPEIIAEVEEFMPVVDFLFIDGNHVGPGPRLDWENYSPLVRPGGIIGFHDTRITEVKDLFDSISYRKQNYDIEFGIGVVWKD